MGLMELVKEGLSNIAHQIFLSSRRADGTGIEKMSAVLVSLEELAGLMRGISLLDEGESQELKTIFDNVRGAL